MHWKAHSSTVQNELQLETTHLPINLRADKAIMVIHALEYYMEMSMNPAQSCTKLCTKLTNVDI